MNRAMLVVVLALLLVPTAGSARKKGGADAHFIHRQGQKTLEQLFQAELARAKAKRKQVVVVFTADWCTPCKIIKDFLEESPETQKRVKKGIIRFIDVDEWRGPAHRLIPGVNPRKLPTIARVDYSGKLVVSCYGTDLGLMSPVSVGDNLARVIAGKMPKKPSYESDPKKRSELLREQVKRDNARDADKEPVALQVVSRTVAGQMATWTVNLTINNKSGPRRWYAISTPGGTLSEEPLVESWEISRFNEHVRATLTRYTGAPSFTVIPVGGHGSAVLKGLQLSGPKTAKALTVWELRSLEVDGKRAQFAKKVPYALNIERAAQRTVLASKDQQLQIRMVPLKKHTLGL